jgi:phosphatidylglycerophosphate synthase
VGTAAYSRQVNRPAGRWFAALAFALGRSPNQVTVLSGVLSVAGIVLLATRPPTVSTAILVATLLVLGYMLDSADGQLARLRGGGSHFGEWLDHTLDCAKTAGLHLAVLISFYRFFDFAARDWYLVPLAFALVAVVMYFGFTFMPMLRGADSGPTPAGLDERARQRDTIRSVVILPTDYGVLCLVFYLLCAHQVFLGIYSALLVANLLFLLLALGKWGLEMRALDRRTNQG